MKFYTSKIIATAVLISFFGLNFCWANSYPDQYSDNLEAQLDQIFADQQNPNATSQDSKEYSYFKAGDDLAIELDNTIIAPEGSIVTGKITKPKRKGMWYQNAKAQVVFNEIDCGEDYKLPIVANIKTKDNSGMLLGGDASQQFKQISSLLLTTSIGGALAGFGFGLLTPYALVGGVVGCGVGLTLGFGWLFFHKGQPINVPSGTKLVITLENDVSVSGFGI
jgi:hypothetical protein